METRNRNAAGFIVWVLAGLLSGCGSGGSMMPPGGTPVSVTFTGGAPLAIALQTGTGAFTPLTVGNQITFTVPQGTITYALAYVCPLPTGASASEEHVFEATTQDSTSLQLLCVRSNPPTLGTATGSASSAIAGTANIEIFGNRGLGGTPLAQGPFSVSLPVGTNDVAALAVDGSANVLGVNILRGQTVPGVINGGSGIVIGDATIPQSVTVNNVPAGFITPVVFVQYITANGTSFSLANHTVGNPRGYVAVPAADTQSGDFYFYESISNNSATPQGVATVQTMTNAGNVTMALPAPWTFSGPTPAKLPTFTFNYSGFAGQPAIGDFAHVGWITGAISNSIDIFATANFQNGANTITFPDLSAIPGFFGPAASGSTIVWFANISGGTLQRLGGGGSQPNESLQIVSNGGNYTQP
jgi:hypothetical protein